MTKSGSHDNTNVADGLGASHATNLEHLSLLKSEGIVTERLSGKTRFFRFTKTLKAQAVMKLLEEWDN